MSVSGIGIDFGTTNSVVALAYDDGRVESRVWPDGAASTATFRTALTFWRDKGALHHVAGPAAIARAAAPIGDQRFIQSLKTHLASRAFSDTRLYGTRFTVEELVSTFLRDLLAGEALPAVPVVAGRPVVFAGAAADETLAVERLRRAFAGAPLPQAPSFSFEPLGAAYWYARDLRRPETVLVADFGGGTSDFSVMRFEPGADGRPRAAPLAHTGVGIAGDTFDARLIERAVSPRLGRGATYRSLGKVLPIPAYFHAMFAQWHQLSWLKTGATLAELRSLADHSDRGGELEDLATVIEMDMGFALHRAVGELKAALSTAASAPLHFAGWGVTIETSVTRAEFEDWITDDLAAIARAIDAALATAGVTADEVDAVFTTGGTSFVPAVQRLFADRFAPERIHRGDAFRSVASGLALMAADAGQTQRASSAIPA